MTSKTLEERVLQKVVITPEGCNLWQGATIHGTPVIRWQGKIVSVRKALAGPGATHYNQATCGNKACVALEHIGSHRTLRARLTALADPEDTEQCWFVRVDRQPALMLDGIEQTARRVAYLAYRGTPPAQPLRVRCNLPGCFNPWHVIQDPETQPEREETSFEIDEIEDCISWILHFGADGKLPYDQPVIDAAKRRIEEEGL